MMRTLSGFFFILLFSHNVFAGTLCDAVCELSVTFPDGGSIEAVEPLTFTFGVGGFINDGVVTTGYSAGDLVSLTSGEVLTFQSGGSLELGIGGNLEYTSIAVTTNGVMTTSAEEPNKVQIYNIEFNGGTFELFGVTEVNAGSAVIINAGVLNFNTGTGVWDVAINWGSGSTNCNTTSGSGSTVISTGGEPEPVSPSLPGATTGITIINGSSAPVISNTGCTNVISINPVALPLSGGTLTITPGTFTTGTLETIDSPTITLTDLTVQGLTQDFMASLPDGVELPTDDGNTCKLTAGECFTASGAKYVVVEGKLVPPAADGSGMINLAGLLTLFSLLMISRLSGIGRRADNRDDSFC